MSEQSPKISTSKRYDTDFTPLLEDFLPPKKVIRKDQIEISPNYFASGAFARILKAEYEYKKVAVKIYNKPTLTDVKSETELEEFKALADEFRLLSRLRHKNVIEVFGCTIHQDSFAMVMELAKYNLADLMKDDYLINGMK